MSAYNYSYATPVTNDRVPKGDIWTPIRCELLKWFQAQASSLAPAYEGAVELVGNASFPGRVHFIAHCVRDISDRLIFVLDSTLDGSRVQYEQVCDSIAKEWPQLDELFPSSSFPTVTDTVPIPLQVAQRIDQLLSAHRSRRSGPSKFELLFVRLNQNDPSQPELNQRIVKEFQQTREWFMRLTHLRRGEPPIVDERELRLRFESFEKILHSFVGNFFTGIRELDAILQQANK